MWEKRAGEDCERFCWLQNNFSAYLFKLGKLTKVKMCSNNLINRFAANNYALDYLFYILLKNSYDFVYHSKFLYQREFFFICNRYIKNQVNYLPF